MGGGGRGSVHTRFPYMHILNIIFARAETNHRAKTNGTGLWNSQIARNNWFYKHSHHILSNLYTYISTNMACPAGRPAPDPVSDLVIVVLEGVSKIYYFA